MKISYGNDHNSLTEEDEVTKSRLAEIIESNNEIVSLLKVSNSEVDESGYFNVPEGLTSIGNFAFADCSSLTTITLPEGITTIGPAAFYDCSSLKTITLPKGISIIGNFAFADCSSLTTITLPEGLTAIGNRAFLRCFSLTTITVQEGITTIGNRAFNECSSLRTIFINTDKGQEVERIKNLLPEEHRDKVVKASFYVETLEIQKQQIEALSELPQITNFYQIPNNGNDYCFSTLPSNVQGVINSFLGPTHNPLLAKAINSMKKLTMPFFEEDLGRYRSQITGIFNFYKAVAFDMIDYRNSDKVSSLIVRHTIFSQPNHTENNRVEESKEELGASPRIAAG